MLSLHFQLASVSPICPHSGTQSGVEQQGELTERRINSRLHNAGAAPHIILIIRAANQTASGQEQPRGLNPRRPIRRPAALWERKSATLDGVLERRRQLCLSGGGADGSPAMRVGTLCKPLPSRLGGRQSRCQHHIFLVLPFFSSFALVHPFILWLHATSSHPHSPPLTFFCRGS